MWTCVQKRVNRFTTRLECRLFQIKMSSGQRWFSSDNGSNSVIIELINGSDVHINCRRTAVGQKAVSVSGAKLWNSIPINIRNSNTIDMFKSHMYQLAPRAPITICREQFQSFLIKIGRSSVPSHNLRCTNVLRQIN